LWRFENYARIQADESALLALEPRLTQIGTPLYSVSTDAGFQARLVKFLGVQADDQRADRPLAVVAEAIHICVKGTTKWPATVTIRDVASYADQVSIDWDVGITFTPKRAGALVRSLGFQAYKKVSGYQFEVTAAQLGELVARYNLGATP